MKRCVGVSVLMSLLGACGPTDDTKASRDSDGSGDSGNSDDSDDSDDSGDSGPTYTSPDFNADGALNILVLGTNQSFSRRTAFSPDDIAVQLHNLFLSDEAAPVDVRVVAEDIHMSKDVTIGLGGGGDEYTYTHHSHSLLQYYYWPDGQSGRWDNLAGNGDTDWDYVVIGADPTIIAQTPGYSALGIHKVAAKVAEGDAQPLLLMMWPQEGTGSSIDDFEEFTYRISDGAPVLLPTVPAGLGWAALSEDDRDTSSNHPSPTGAYMAAATIYSQITGTPAAFDGDTVSDVAHSTVIAQATAVHYDGERAFVSPFMGCGVTDSVVTYNHTGSSSESGILEGLRWVFDRAPQTLENGGEAPLTFNYGRANTNFEANKRYQVDPERFDYSFGFAMQDHGNNGDVSMLYGLDYRDSGVVNDTDLGVAQYMIEQDEMPHARAIPIRTLFAQLKEAFPEQSAYRDAWHMHRDLDKASAGYMYAILTGDCSLDEEPEDPASSDWRTWNAHRTGCQTAWTFMHLDANSPF